MANLKKVSKHINYYAKVVKINELIPHSNANKMQIAVIDNLNIITGLDTKLGDVVVMFPIECAINKDFLSKNNLFSHKEFNQDITKVGYFDNNGRVRAVKLRGIPSEGFIIPIEFVMEFCKDKFDESNVGMEFDYVNNVKMCEKYIPLSLLQEEEEEIKKKPFFVRLFNKYMGIRNNRIVEGQFKFSQDVSHLEKNINMFSEDDIITISYKMHGSNGCYSRLLCKKEFSWFSLFRKESTYYDNIFASRKVIKNGTFSNYKNVNEFDKWVRIGRKYAYALENGITLYGELVGYDGNKFIQEDYDYSCYVGECEFYVFRITSTNKNNKVYNFSHDEMKSYCEKYELPMVPIFYNGRICDLIKFKSLDWRKEFLAYLKEQYLEKDCFMCKNKVPAEGIVVRRNDIFGRVYECFKYKSFRFKEKESKELDKNVTMEE